MVKKLSIKKTKKRVVKENVWEHLGWGWYQNMKTKKVYDWSSIRWQTPRKGEE